MIYQESCRLVSSNLTRSAGGRDQHAVRRPTAPDACGRLVEGWRGRCWVAPRSRPEARIHRCIRTILPWQNWAGGWNTRYRNIVSGFSVYHKSFNSASSGHDL